MGERGDGLASKSRAQFDKRRKELDRQNRQKEKRARKAAEKERKGEGGAGVEEDPDIAGIQLGPQPVFDEDAADTEDSGDEPSAEDES